MSADVDTSRLMSGYVMTYVGGAGSWRSKLQKFVALSTKEAEYMVVVEADKEVIWMKDFIRGFGIGHEEFQLYCDNQSVIHLAKNAAYHSSVGNKGRQCGNGSINFAMENSTCV